MNKIVVAILCFGLGSVITDVAQSHQVNRAEDQIEDLREQVNDLTVVVAQQQTSIEQAKKVCVERGVCVDDGT